MDKKKLGIIGVGAFGELAAKHLAPHFSLILHDPHKDLSLLAKTYATQTGTLADAVQCDFVMLAVPVQSIEATLRELAPHIKPDAVFFDVASVKSKPVDLMKKLLPETVSIVGTHPLFGPVSGKNGIRGLNIVLCPARGDALPSVRRFCRKELGLRVFVSTPQAHDREMAYVQGLTHLISKAVVSMDLPTFRFTTKTYDLMHQMVENVRNDSEALFRAIEKENPFSSEPKKAFFDAVRKIEKKLESAE